MVRRVWLGECGIRLACRDVVRRVWLGECG